VSEKGEKNMAKKEQIIKDAELENVAGGIEKGRRQENNECPKCWQPVEIYTDAMIEGYASKPGVYPVYTCEYCRLKWIARSFYNNAIVRHEMISYDKVNGAHQYLGEYQKY
jgi:hypothetical protein